MVQNRSPRKSSVAQSSWSLYHLLVLLRICVAPFLLGYVHPDEFFQGGQELWFGCPPQRPWEFEPQNALRSIMPPTLMTWWPLQLGAWFLGIPMQYLSGWYIWILPRVACAIMSILAVDISIWKICSQTSSSEQNGVPGPVLLLASAWPTMVLLNRPFTNSMETWILALLLCVALSNEKKEHQPTILQCVLFGALSAVGIFTRFTFVCFAFPIVLYFGYRMLRTFRWWEWLVKPALTCLVFFLVGYQIVKLDTAYYSNLDGANQTEETQLVLAPWNAYSYNSKTDNLQEHGLHPRWTHAAVNIFLLFGPLALVGYFAMAVGKTFHSRTTAFVCQGVFLSGLSLLSSAPHQEPRFLLPLLVPLVLLCDNSWVQNINHAKTIWVVFNISLLIVFGVLHQSGIVPSLLAEGSILSDQQPSAIIYYRTYMPPTFLSRPSLNATSCTTDGPRPCPGSDETACQDILISDLNGSQDLAALHLRVAEALSCDEESDASVHIVTSPQLDIVQGQRWYLGGQHCVIPGYQCEILWNHTPHLTTEDFPSPADVARDGMPLTIYRVSCLS